MARPRSSDYLSPRAAAEYLSARGYPLGRATVAKLCDNGTLPHVKTPGGERRIRTAALDLFLTAHVPR